MESDRSLDHYAVAVVSCDIVGHSSATDGDQVARVAAINRIVAGTIDSCPAGDVVWASGGDGGHVAFRQQEWQQPTIRLILDLHQWSTSRGVPLRITAHRGTVADIRGADGRVQLVGGGINYAGWLLTQVTCEGVVVSDAFRRDIEPATVEPAPQFHDPRSIPNVDYRPELLFLMSVGDVRSAWIDAVQGDRAALEQAVRQDGGWDVLYYAKRIWQVNSGDQDVVRALESVKPHHLRYRDSRSLAEDVNPFFGHLQPDELMEVLRLGHLVERRRGEIICRYNDAGDTMFVILRGQVGVYNSEGEGFDGAAEPKHVQRRGEIVGELAYALSRDRTADLMALTDVALLSFNNEDLRSRLSNTQVGEAANHQVSTFINYRVLQHVSDNAAYLLGPRRTGPLAMGPSYWNYALTTLRKHCELIAVDTRMLDLTLDDLPTPAARHRGLYILTAGELRAHDSDGEVLRGTDFPVLWVDVPNLCPFQPFKYHVQDEPVKVLRIAAAGIDELDARKREALRNALPRAVNRRPDKYEFDVFLCHSKRDWATVCQIRDRLQAAGVRCWLDEERILPGASVTTSIEQGLRSSRFLLACVSANLAESDWAQLELRSALHVDVKRPADRSVVLLMLNADEDKNSVVPLLLRDAKCVHYTRGHEFDDLVEYILRPQT